MPETKPVRKRLKAAEDIGRYMADYYYELDAAAKSGEKKFNIKSGD